MDVGGRSRCLIVITIILSSLQGVNVREKAKIVMLLVQDEEKRKEERAFAMKTKDKLANGNGSFNNSEFGNALRMKEFIW